MGHAKMPIVPRGKDRLLHTLPGMAFLNKKYEVEGNILFFICYLLIGNGNYNIIDAGQNLRSQNMLENIS